MVYIGGRQLFNEESRNEKTNKDDEEVYTGIYRNKSYLKMKEMQTQEELTYGKLEIIDVDEFKNLKLDYSIIECLRDKNYKNLFKFESTSGNYTLKFEKIAHDKNEFYEFVIFKARSHIFDKQENFSIYENMIVYFFDDDEKWLNLIEHDEIIEDLLNDYYYCDNSSSDGEDEENLQNDSLATEDSDTSDDIVDDIPLEVTENWTEKLFDERYNEPIVLKNHFGEKMILKRIGRVDYRKKEYLIVKILQKKFEMKNIFIVYVVNYDESGDMTDLATVKNKMLDKKIKKIYAKKNKLKFSELFKE